MYRLSSSSVRANILDTAGNLLYSGEDNYSVTGNASNQLTVKQQAESIIKNEVKKVLIGTGELGKIEVASNMVLDFSSSDKTEHLYELPDGQDQGFVVNENTFSSESEGGTNGVPGTDSNTESTYVYQDNNYTSETTTEESKDRVYNEIITQQSIPPGLIKYSDSSIAATLVRYKVVEESSAKNQGLLDGITWDEYKTANGERTKLTIDEDLFQIVSKATGFSLDNISIVAYEEPVFMDKEGMTIKPADIMQIVLIVLIVGLLIFVVFRSMKPSKIEMEEEEELSVENLLQSTPQAEIEDIELESKSETRRMIEKFVDENPEAVASLLRNWLNEEWG